MLWPARTIYSQLLLAFVWGVSSSNRSQKKRIIAVEVIRYPVVISPMECRAVIKTEPHIGLTDKHTQFAL